MGKLEMSRFAAMESGVCGQCGPEEAPGAILWYLDFNCCSRHEIELPETETWRVETLDTWNMTRETVMAGVSGKQEIPPAWPRMDGNPGHKGITAFGFADTLGIFSPGCLPSEKNREYWLHAAIKSILARI